MNVRVQHSGQKTVEHLWLVLDVLNSIHPIRLWCEHIFLQRRRNPIRQDRLGEELEITAVEPG